MNEAAEALDDASKTSTWMGFLTVIVGIIALGSPLASGVALTYLIAILLIIGGITRGIYAFKAGSLGKGILMLGLWWASRCWPDWPYFPTPHLGWQR